MANELGWISVPVVPTFVGVTKQLSENLVKPAEKAGKQVTATVEKTAESMVQNLDKQVAASSAKLDGLDKAYVNSVKSRETQQHKLNAALAEQAAAEEKYQEALKKGKSGTAELAKMERARAKVSDETIKMAAAEDKIVQAEKNHKAQLDDLTATIEKREKAQADLNAEVVESKSTMGGLGGVMSDLGEKASGMGGKFGGAADILTNFKAGPTAGLMAVAGGIGAAAMAFGKFNDDLAKSQADIQNTMGLSADAARDMQGEIADALGSGMGNYEETSQAVLAISQTLGDNVAQMGGQTAAQLADDFMAFNETFEKSAAETASTVDVMLNSGLVDSAQQGIDLLTVGMQKVPAAMRDEVFDAMNEYSKHFATLGINGSDAMAMLVSASKNGQYAIDKTGDALKEFSIRGSDMSKTSAEAYAKIGLSAEEMSAKIAKGGDGAQDALRQTAEGLLKIEDPAERANAAIALFGTPVEDLGVDKIPDFLESLTATGDGMGDFAGAAQTMADNTSRTFSGMVASWKGTIQGWAIDATLAVDEGFGNMISAVQNSPLIDAVGSLFTGVKDTVSAAWQEITIAFNGGDWGYGALANIIGAGNAEWIIDKVASVKDAWEEITTAFMGGDWGYGALGNLIGADNAKSLVNSISDIGDRVLEFRDKVVDAFGQARDFVGPILTDIGEFAKGQLGEVLASLGEALGSFGEALGSVASALGGTLLTAGQALFDILLKVWDFISPILIPAFQFMAGIVGGVLTGAFFLVVGAIRVASEVIEALAGAGAWLIEHTLTPMIGAVGSLIQWFRDGGVAADILKSVFVGLGSVILVSMIPALVQLIGQWILTGVQATIAGAKQVAAWVVTGAAAAANGAGTLLMLGKTAAGWVLAGVQSTAAALKMAAAWVIAMGPVGWVIAGITAVVAGLTWFFTQTEVGKEAWASFTGFLSSAWQTVVDGLTAAWEWIKTTVLDAWTNYWALVQANWVLLTGALTAGWTWVKDLFVEGWLAIQEFVVGAWTLAWETVRLGWETFTNALITGWNWVRDSLVEAWTSIQEFVINGWTFAWEAIRAGWETFTSWIVDGFNLVKDGLVAAWEWISSVVVAGWNREVDGMRAAWEFVTGALIGAWNWVRDSFSAVWDWISSVVVAGWNREVDGMKRIFEFVTDAISGAWNWLKDVLHAGWTWIDSNVFGALGRGLDIVKGWFQSAVDGIGRVWDGLRRAAGAPVKFVIDTVWNNGILGAWNKIADFLPGIDPVEPFKPEWLGQFKTGGVLPGWSPGRDIHEFYSPTAGRLHLSGYESIMRPEWTRAVGGPAAVEAMNAAARRGDSYGALPKSLMGTVPNPEAHAKIDPDALHRAISDQHFATGGIYVPNPTERAQLGGAAINTSLWQAAKTAFPGATLNSAMTDHDNDGGYHPHGAAVDLGGPMQQIANWIFEKWPKTAQLIFGPGPLALWGNTGHIDPSNQAGIRAAYGEATMAGHYDHVHWGADGVITSDGKMVSADAGSGGTAGGMFNWLASKAQGIWAEIVDPLKDKISGKMAELGESRMTQIPMEFFNKVKDAAWEKLSGFFGASGGSSSMVSLDGLHGDTMAVVQEVFARHGWTGQQWEDAKWIIGKESSWDTSATNPSSGAFGLFQFNPSGGNTLGAYLPTKSTDPATQGDAGARYIRDRYGDPSAARRFWEANGWYADGGTLPVNLSAGLYDNGGWLPHGGMAVNRSGKPEPVFNDAQWSVLSRGLLAIGDLVPALKAQTEVMAKQVAATEAWLAKAADPGTEEGVMVRALASELGGIIGSLGGESIAKVTSAVLESEQAILDARAAQATRLEAISDKEKALADAQSALKDAMGESEEASKELAKASQESADKIKDAEDKLTKAKEDNAPADGDDDKKKKDKADKIAKAEEDLAKVRTEQADKSEEAEKKRAENVEKANEGVAKAEADLAKARLESVRSLDMPVHDLLPQLGDLADAGAKAAGTAGLGGLADTLAGIAALTGPSGISVGVAIEVVKQVISIGKLIKDLIEELIEKIYKARLAARKALAEGFANIAEHAKLVTAMQENIAKLQQSLVRGMNEQRSAEFALKVAQQDRLVAEAEGALSVAQARLALDEEIRKAAVAAQIRLMGLHEDWDSYLAYQAVVAGGVLEQWSDVAISALYTYEAVRAKALQGELKARLDQIVAEAKLAELARKNVRNQQDLLTAQERLIKMSAKVAGVDLVEATGGQQATKLLMEMFENQQAMDKNVLGKWGYQMGADGSYANEYRGQLAQKETLQKALDAVMAESGVSLDGLDRERLFRLMGEAAYRGGDPMAVLRSQLPQLVEAETALKVSESLKPIYDAKDQLDEQNRLVEDLAADIDLYSQSTPLEETIKGLDYTIKGLEQSSDAWAKGNEDVRREYLAAAKANAEAAKNLGVTWQLDEKYNTGIVRDRIVKEEHIYVDGSVMYTADQVDELLAKVTAGSDVNVVMHRTASDVATARRKESI